MGLGTRPKCPPCTPARRLESQVHAALKEDKVKRPHGVSQGPGITVRGDGRIFSGTVRHYTRFPKSVWKIYAGVCY